VKVSPCTSISEQGSALSAVMIYPNPSNGEFVIEADQAMTLTIINELGQVVRTVTLSDATFKANVNHLPAGVYFVTGTKGNTKINQKIIVQ
jgi:hypothetical protein